MAYSRQLEDDLDQAHVLYRKSIKLHATAEAHVHLGWALATKGELDEAIEHCEKAIQLDAFFANPWNDIGAYLIEQDRAEDSLFFLKRAVRMRQYATRCFPHYNLHRAYLALGDRNRAVTHLHEALDADPDFGPALAALSGLMFPYHEL
jgi:Tfp pilus assembly protein PilF